MLRSCHLFFLWFALRVTGCVSFELFTLHDSTSVTQQTSSHSPFPVAIAVQKEHLKDVSGSVLMAESWTRTNVLAHYPVINISTVVVGHTLLCENGQGEKLGLVLPSLKNILYTLTRWGLHKRIKVSALFSSSCMRPVSGSYRADIADTYIRPLLSFLQDNNLPYLVKSPSHLPAVSDDIILLLNSHSKAMNGLGFFNLSMIIMSGKEVKTTRRKLSFVDPRLIDPFPARPTPLSPSYPPSGSSAPGYGAKSPLSPLIGKISPPPLSLPFAPERPPVINPASPPYGIHFPPCNPSYDGDPVAAPVEGVRKGLWCVAKPSVPPETLQVALNYACGEGGADCEAIRPRGSCYYPNTVVAHASYAFNSYWQKTKKNDGTCGFEGTAMLIDSDPSYRHCRFSLA